MVPLRKNLEEAQLAAKEKRVAAEKKLQSETWSGWDGSKFLITSKMRGRRNMLKAKEAVAEDCQ